MIYLLYRSYRRKTLFKIGADLQDEVDFTHRFAKDCPKNYQLWHHLQCIIDAIGSPGKELEHLMDVFTDDAKNHHAWLYRKWLVERFNLPIADELGFTSLLLKQDPYNNSAWNYRAYLIRREGKRKESCSLEAELKYVLDFIEIAPDNESAWNYLRPIADEPCVRLIAEQYPSSRLALELLLHKEPCEAIRTGIVAKLIDLDKVRRNFYLMLGIMRPK